MYNPCLSGELNITFTSSTALLLGGQIGSLLGGGRVGIAASNEDVLFVIKHSLISGLASAGSRIYDLLLEPLPVLRYSIRKLNLDFGVYIHLSADNIVSVKLLDKHGCELPESEMKKIENTYVDFCEPNEIKPIVSMQNSYVHYVGYLQSQFPPVDRICEVQCDNPLINKITENLFVGDSSDRLFSARIHDNGERATFFTSRDIPVSDEQSLAVFCLLLFKYGQINRFVAPISQSCIFEEIAAAHKGKIIRCKTDKTDIMQSLISNKLFMQFNLMFDACFAVMFLCNYLRREDKTLKELTDTLPSLHICEHEVECGLANKENIVKALSEAEKKSKYTIKNGIKIKDKHSWILVVPHKDRPSCRVIAEGKTQEYARELADIYVKKVQKIIDRKNKTIQK